MELYWVVHGETLFVTFEMQIVGCFFGNSGNLELNHSDGGAGKFAVAELWLEANNAFLVEADKKGAVLWRDQCC